MNENFSNRVLENSLYHNQFVLGPTFVEQFKTWNRLEISNYLYLTAHPNLNIYKATCNGKSVTLIGYILDPYNPEDDDRKIIDKLANSFDGWEKFIKSTYRFGGRWILIIHDSKRLILFNDAAGQRQVFYTDTSQTKDLWCASQSGAIAEILKLEMGRDAVDFINSFSEKNKEYWWPGDSSPYNEIKHLIPNHYLDLKTGQSFRYWPDENFSRISLNKGAEKSASILKGLMKSASNRYDLVLGITAGWDSRLVLASAKEVKDRITGITTKQLHMPDDYADLTVPSHLLPHLGIRHEVVKTFTTLDEGFLKVYKKNSPFSHDLWAPDALAEFKYNKQKKMVVTGGVSETVRAGYFFQYFSTPLPRGKESISGEDISKSCGMGSNPFSIGHFQKWLTGLLPQLYNYSLENILYWEQRAGNWLAMSTLEHDIAWKDILTPYNCRELLINMLSVHVKHRNLPKLTLYNRMILILWPETLDFPINPHRIFKKQRIHIRFKNNIKDKLSMYLPDYVKKYLKKILNITN